VRAGRLADGREVAVYGSLDELSMAGAAMVARALADADAGRGRAVLALAGGSTPRALHERLAAAHRDDVPGGRTTVVFGDDRCVPPTDAGSNYRMAHETLLAHVPVRPALVHRVAGELPLSEAADAYDALMRQAIGAGADDRRPAHALDAPLLDVTMLGVGEDGHTASLFPGAATLDERARWAVAATAPAGVPGPRARVTLTLPVLDASRLVLVLVSGAGKREAVRAALLDTSSPSPLPSARVRAMGRTVWLLDGSAAHDEVIGALG
jgi:6-phosphogluconolactonase